MLSIHRILVAVKDPSARALPAIAKATQLAGALDADLELFHAIDSPGCLEMTGAGEECALQAERDERAIHIQRLERVAARVRLHAKHVSAAVERDYPPSAAIIRRAEATGADLIVAECHAGSHMAAGLRRLSDWELVRSSPVPVLLVRLPRPYHHPTILTAVDPNRAFAKPPQLDDNLLQLGTLFTNALCGRLHAVHTYVPTSATDLARATAAGFPVAAGCALDAKRRFDLLLKGADILPIRRHLIGGSPGDGIPKLARRLRADIVLAGSASRTGLQRLLIGNTSERLLSSLPCDLLVVKPHGSGKGVPTGSHDAGGVTLLPAC